MLFDGTDFFLSEFLPLSHVCGRFFSFRVRPTAYATEATFNAGEVYARNLLYG